jgi:predicted DNA-binding protein with PD1-like motif
MEYRTGSTGRVFQIRFDHKDDFLGELLTVIKKENIRNAWFHCIGGILEADVVIGPKEPTMPPDPIWEEVRSPRELLGTGSILWDEHNEPRVHLHTSLGDHGSSMTVCTRKGTKVYLIVEVYIIEIIGIEATRPWFPKGGFNKVDFTKK